MDMYTKLNYAVIRKRKERNPEYNAIFDTAVHWQSNITNINENSEKFYDKFDSLDE